MDSKVKKRMNFKLMLVLIGLVFFSACKTTSHSGISDVLKAQRAILPADSMIRKQQSGTDLVAGGNEPVAWRLEIDFDKSVKFNAADGNTLNIIPSFSDRTISGETEIYRSVTGTGNLEIRIIQSTCTNAKTGEQTGKEVMVSLGKNNYTGCGKYLYDHRLNDVWELESVNNTPQVAKDFAKGIPVVEFNLLSNKMTGHDGCNNISSSIEIKGKRIKFFPIMSTKMYCNNNLVEKLLSEKISGKLVDYYMENNKLVLYLSDDSRVIFRRKAL